MFRKLYQTKYCKLVTRFVLAKLLIVVSTTLLLKTSQSLLIFKVLTIVVLLELVIILCYVYCSPWKSLVVVLTISTCSQGFGIAFLYVVSLIPNLLQWVAVLLAVAAVCYLLIKTNYIIFLLEKNTRDNIIVFCLCLGLISVVCQLISSILIPELHEMMLLNNVSIPLTSEVVGATSGMSGAVGAHILHMGNNHPKPPLNCYMGNSGSRGVGALGSGATRGAVSHMSMTGGGKPINYPPSFILEFQRWINVYRLKDKDFVDGLERKHVLRHPNFVNNHLTQEPEDKRYSEKNNNELIEEQNQFVNKTTHRESLNKFYEDTKNETKK